MFNKKLFYICMALLLALSVVSAGKGANEPIDSNTLGETAKACASLYCDTKDGMALWLSLLQGCSDSPNPYMAEISNNDNNDSSGWSPAVVGVACAIMGVVGLYIGYNSGMKKKKTSYPLL